MALVSMRNIRLAFGGPVLLDDLTFQIGRCERVCLVGRNGAGKSTLLRLITGEVLQDSGEIIREQGVKITSLSQEVPQDLEGTVFDVVSSGLGEAVGLLAQYRMASSRVARDGSEEAIAAVESIQHEIEAKGAWGVQQKVDMVISRLGLEPDAVASSLSGGFKRRVLLAKALVGEPDLLLLDEPTNHLDIDSIIWLEQFLLEFRGSILFITHDRRFLQTLARRIIELDRGRLTDWPGDYDAYMKRKQAELDAEATRDALFDKKLAREEAWIRKGIKARRTRNEGRVRALKEMRRERHARRELTGSVKMKMNEAERSGKLVVEADDVDYIWEKRTVIRDFSTIIMRGDKVGIIGPNGSGKTTLLRVLLGELKPHKGTVRPGTRLEVAYFDQHRAVLDDEKSVQENVGDGYNTVTVNGRTRHIIGYLEDFLFPPERSRSPVKVLSGGERNRALLAKLFTKPSNVLVLDEPTNDLDADTLELLEDLLVEYSGTVLLVSHDRAFLNNVVTSTLVFEGDGKIGEYVGGYDDWLSQRKAGPPVRKEKEKAVRTRPQRERSRTLSFREKRELEDLPQLIERLETERDQIFKTMSDPAFYQESGEKVSAARGRLEELEKEIASAYARWEALEAIPEKS